MKLILVKSLQEDAKCENNSGINYSAAMTRCLVEPWKNRIELFVGTHILHLLPQFKGSIAFECDSLEL